MRHRNWVYPLAFAPDGRTLASGCNDGKVRLWDLREPVPPVRAVLPWGNTKNEGTLAFAPDGRTLASGGGDGRIVLWDPGPGTAALGMAAAGELATADRAGVGRLRPDSRYLAAGTLEGTIYVLRLQSAPARANDSVK